MEHFQHLADLIILVGGVCMAITTICKMIGKPIGFFKKREEQKREQELKEEAIRIKAILTELLPNMFLEHDLETRKKYKGDRENYLKEIKCATLEDLQSPLDELIQIQRELKEELEKVNRSTKDMLRQRIIAIYDTYKVEGKIPQTVRENLDELYKDYTSQGGNSYITKYYKRMIQWEVIPDIHEEI
jgi:dGTP triphosphohydrolase